MTYEYKTTCAKWRPESGHHPAQTPDPVVPEGDGWELFFVSATEEDPGGTLFWTWRREVKIAEVTSEDSGIPIGSLRLGFAARGLSVRATNSLYFLFEKHDLTFDLETTTLHDIAQFSEPQVLAVQGCGRTTFDEIRRLLAMEGLVFSTTGLANPRRAP